MTPADRRPPQREQRPPSRRRRARPAAGLGLNLTAMIDVVFLLLVYFMAATEFKLGEEVYRLDLPQRGRAVDPYELPREPLWIVVASTRATGGRGYRLEVSAAPLQPTTFDELYRFLNQNRRATAAMGGLFEPDHPIIVQPTETARWEHAVEAFNAVVRAHYTNVTFAEPG